LCNFGRPVSRNLEQSIGERQVDSPTSESQATGYGHPLGFTLELLPEQNPYALRPGDELAVLLFQETKPVEGVLIVAMNRSEPTHKLSARSDAEGRARFRLQKAWA